MRFLMLILVFVIAGCSGATSEPESTTAEQDPVTVVKDWLDAVVAGDLSTIDRLVEPLGLAVVAAVENNLRSDELAGLLTAGLSDDLQSEYWTAFRDDFAAIRGSSLADIEVGSEIVVPGLPDFAAVEITAEGTVGILVVRRTDVGWQIDFVATVGPALVGPLGEYLAGAVEGDHAAAIADSYRTAVIPGLEAAIVLDAGNSVLAFETEFIRQLADS